MSKELIERLKNEGDGVMSRREKTLLAGYIEELEKERDELLALVIRYRKETPLGHQPHMIAHLVDEALAKVRKP